MRLGLWILLAMAPALAAHAAPGDLDVTFGDRGRVSTSIGATPSGRPALATGSAVAVDRSGGILVGGMFDGGAGFTTIIARYRPDGTLDARFANAGVAVVGSASSSLVVLAPAPDGGVFVASPDGDSVAVRHLDASGALDTSFGARGIASATFAVDYADPTALALLPDGRIVVAGCGNLGSGGFPVFTLARFRRDGALDTSFGDLGVVHLGTAGLYGCVHAMLAAPDGSIRLVGNAHGVSGDVIGLRIAKLDSSGRLDESFGRGGVGDDDTMTDASGYALFEPDGALLLPTLDEGSGGTVDGVTHLIEHMELVRYRADGVRDLAFGAGGVAGAPLFDAHIEETGLHYRVSGTGPVAVARQSDGKLLLAGNGEVFSFGEGRGVDSYRAMVVARFTANGALDTGFGSGGIVSANFKEGFAEAAAITLQPDGKLVVAGSASDTRYASAVKNLAVARILTAPPASGIVPQTGLWWNPNASGRGVFVERRGDALFVSGYLYDASGRPLWFVASGSEADDSLVAPLLAFHGGQPLTGAYAAPIADAPLGTMTLRFTSATTATLAWPGGTESVARFGVDAGRPVAPRGGTPRTGFWWNPAESGRGYAIDVQGDTMIVAAYGYADDGAPLWLLSAGPMRDTMSYRGTWQTFADGQAFGAPYRVPRVSNADAGAVQLRFSDTEDGVLTLPDGREISIVPFPF